MFVMNTLPIFRGENKKCDPFRTKRDFKMSTCPEKSGLGLRLSVFRANHSCFVSERAKVRFTLLLSGRSFVKSEGSESLKSLLKKERMSKKRCEQFALGHKKGENCQKHVKNTNFSSKSLFFLQDIHLNHERITHINLI